jgi:hypothetical protein
LICNPVADDVPEHLGRILFRHHRCDVWEAGRIVRNPETSSMGFSADGVDFAKKKD